MEQSKLDRINSLAKKSKETALSQEELAEQKALREEYIDSFRNSMRGHLENVYFVDENGKKTKAEPKK